MKKRLSTLAAAIGLAAASPALAADISVTVTNISHNMYLTPPIVAAHDALTDMYDVGAAASADLQAMAECGDTSGLSTTLTGAGADVDNSFAMAPLAPGASATANLMTAAGNDLLSVTAMILPTNDGFVGLDAVDIPTTPGTYSFTLTGYDAGTEANDELFSMGCSPGLAGIPADPTGMAGTGGTGAAGADANATVHVHRGVLGDTNPTGGVSDLDAAEHRFLNPVARVELTVN